MTLCVASQRVFVVVYFVIDPVRKLLDTSSYSIFPCISLNILTPNVFQVKILYLNDNCIYVQYQCFVP
jgi:hypothetical protein